MYGAIIGDLAGSIYEFDQVKKVHDIHIEKIITEDSFYSDDTILTIAILDAILHDKDYEKYLKDYTNRFLSYLPKFKPYFKMPFSPGFIKWVQNEKEGNSIGNGAMMRVSPIGYMLDNEDAVIENVLLATSPSHNSKEAIDASTKVALTIFYLRRGLTKEEVYKKLDIVPMYHPFIKFNTTCNETFNNCMYTLYNSSSFDDAIIKAISMGGDTDTNAAIVGSMAEALYGIDEELILSVNEKIPSEFIDTLDKGYSKIKRL